MEQIKEILTKINSEADFRRANLTEKIYQDIDKVNAMSVEKMRLDTLKRKESLEKIKQRSQLKLMLKSLDKMNKNSTKIVVSM